MEQQLANLECNAVCAVAITHYFLAKMVRKHALSTLILKKIVTTPNGTKRGFYTMGHCELTGGKEAEGMHCLHVKCCCCHCLPLHCTVCSD